ncbi:MAG: hypothetical protein ABSF26_21485 [Thermoguttaceae bacterium]|jgi:hypothetical protein
MKVHGLPETLWFVVSPTPNSDLGDICFECDFERFALQIRGGLDERKIVGIFADETEAKELADNLLRAIHRPTEEPDIRIHKSPWPEWFATQESLAGVAIVSKATGEKVIVEPPKEWGHDWGWNFTADGSGIVMRHTK